MKLIIAGGRNYRLTAEAWELLDSLGDVSQVISGDCRGVDRDGETWAEARGIPVRKFPAQWSLGPQAGPLRNRQMAQHAHALVAFPGGQGTADMVAVAIEQGLVVYDWRGVDKKQPQMEVVGQ